MVANTLETHHFGSNFRVQSFGTNIRYTTIGNSFDATGSLDVFVQYLQYVFHDGSEGEVETKLGKYCSKTSGISDYM